MSVKTIAEMMAEIREVNTEKGWRSPDGGPCPGQTWGDYIVLLHSEVSEALEAYRDYRLVDATRPICGNEGITGRPCPKHGTGKPEGVGSELADVLIRLLDMCDVFGISPSGCERLADVVDHRPVKHINLESFGDHLSALHLIICDAWREPQFLPVVLRTLVMVTRRYGIDLNAEYERKIAYNRTRGFQHGGRTLAGSKDVKAKTTAEQRLSRLKTAMPDDPRGWWTGEESDAFIDEWRRLELPELTMGDGQVSHYVFWTVDVERAARMLGVECDVDGFRIDMGEYSVGIVPAEKK